MVQEKLADLMSMEMTAQRRRLEYEKPESPDSIYCEMEELWKNEYVPITSEIMSRIEDPLLTPIEWNSVKMHLYDAATRIQVKTINGTAKDALDYKDNPEGMSVIAIGGDKLSRGLTLEGLTVSYYLRASRMYDTLMQMGRWFGFRPGYIDLCRLYTSHELVEWYRFINLASEELRREFDYMASLKATPRDYGLRVRTHPDGLKITAVNKMRSGTEMELSFSNSIEQTVFFGKDPKILEDNLILIEKIIGQLGKESEKIKDTPVWKGIKSEIVLQILDDYHFFSSTTRPDLMRQYIRNQNTEGELNSWTIALISKQNPEHTYLLNGYKIGLTERKPDPDRKDLYAIKKGQIISPRHELIDLSTEEREAAFNGMHNNPDRMGKDISDTTIPSGPYIRCSRPPTRGLLLIYTLDPAELGVKNPVIGLAFSFPESKKAVPITYKVNNIYWEQEFDNQ